MAAKDTNVGVTSHSQRTKYDHILTFEIELRFDEEVDPDPTKLLDTIPDVLFAADDKHRLLPGYPLPVGGERLIGTAASLKAVAREPSRIPTTKFEPPPHWDEGDSMRSELLRHSVAIDAAIEDLLETQAKLWEQYERITPREQVSNFAARIRAAKQHNRTFAADASRAR